MEPTLGMNLKKKVRRANKPANGAFKLTRMINTATAVMHEMTDFHPMYLNTSDSMSSRSVVPSSSSISSLVGARAGRAAPATAVANMEGIEGISTLHNNRGGVTI